MCLLVSCYFILLLFGPGGIGIEGILLIPPKHQDWSLTIICSLLSYPGECMFACVFIVIL